MKIISNRIIHDDGRHNAFPSSAFVRWRGRYWLAFRTATHHRAHDGRITLISSEDLEMWSEPSVIIDTGGDDRSPSLFVLNDRLFAVVPGRRATYEDEVELEGMVTVHDAWTVASSSADGVHWDAPRRLEGPLEYLWWVQTRGDVIYANSRLMRRRIENGQQVGEDVSSLVRSRDGFTWELAGVICDEHDASETAFDFLPDGRCVALVRHDDGESKPEIRIADPPYAEWLKVLDFPFRCQGPCLFCVGERIYVAGRTFFKDENTPLLTDEIKPLKRGLLILRVDPEAGALVPELMVPHSTGALTLDSGKIDPKGMADISYASAIDLGDGRAAMAYYEGYKYNRAWIRMLMLDLELPEG